MKRGNGLANGDCTIIPRIWSHSKFCSKCSSANLASQLEWRVTSLGSKIHQSVITQSSIKLGLQYNWSLHQQNLAERRCKTSEILLIDRSRHQTMAKIQQRRLKTSNYGMTCLYFPNVDAFFSKRRDFISISGVPIRQNCQFKGFLLGFLQQLVGTVLQIPRTLQSIKTNEQVCEVGLWWNIV